MVTITIDNAPPDMVSFRLETTDLTGAFVTEVTQEDEFQLHVYVQDIRSDSITDRGIFQAYIDVTFDQALVTASEPIVFGANYLELNSGNVTTPGVVDEAGGSQTGFGLETPLDGPWGPEEFLLFTVPFTANDTGTVLFESDPADVDEFHDVKLFAPPSTVDPTDIQYGTTTLVVNAAPVVTNPDDSENFTTDEDTAFITGNVLDNDIDLNGDPLFVSALDSTNTAGTVSNNENGTFSYDPNGQFDFVKPGETATDTFYYTATDGNPGHESTALVTITITGVNDAPVAVNDSGDGFATDENSAFTTATVLANDTDVEDDLLSLISCDTSSTIGEVTCNADGTIDYDPNGQFDFLDPGATTTDSFTYSISDGTDVATATATITIQGAPTGPGTINGFVYADVDNDGVKDAVERAIGDVTIQLDGTDVLGNSVSRTTTTDSLGRFQFADIIAGNYELVEVQPRFFVDGIDTVDGVVHSGTNDRITIDSSNIDGAQLDILFGERSIHPDFISIADLVNSALREGVVIGLDTSGNPLWHSTMNGWENATSVDATFSTSGTSGHLSVTLDSGQQQAYLVPTDPAAGFFRIMGTTDAGQVVQFVGTMSDFQPLHSAAVVDAAFADLGQ